MARLSFNSIGETWQLYSAAEKRNMAFYILGIMLYKFGLEAWVGSITALATNRYDWEGDRADAAGLGRTINTFERIGLLQGLNQTAQCIGSILIAPLIKRFPTRTVLGWAVSMFALLTSLLMILDATTGGRIKPRDVAVGAWGSYYGTYPSDSMIPIYAFAGIAYGMVELIRRVIPRDIVGSNVQKLRRLDAIVHIFYETSGTAGAFCTALVLIPNLGNNYSFIVTPVLFTAAAASWFMISTLNFKKLGSGTPSGSDAAERPFSYLRAMRQSFVLFFKSIWVGGRLLLTTRKHIWLIPGYAFALYGHRYLETAIAPVIAQRYLNNSAWAQIMVGGSNFGELLGASFVFLFTNLINTPMPWLRLDALALLVVWYLPFWHPSPTAEDPTRFPVTAAWKVAATFIPISFGWAAGDVSLSAYIQASLARSEHVSEDVSKLGAVMAFLYSTYIALYAILNPILGAYIDRVDAADRARRGLEQGDVRPAIRTVAGIQFTVLACIIMLATFIPRGAVALNPPALFDERLDEDIDEFTGEPKSKLTVGTGNAGYDIRVGRETYEKEVRKQRSRFDMRFVGAPPVPSARAV